MGFKEFLLKEWHRLARLKKFHFENISENLCLTVIILGFFNVSPYNFLADIFGNATTFTAPTWAQLPFGRTSAVI